MVLVEIWEPQRRYIWMKRWLETHRRRPAARELLKYLQAIRPKKAHQLAFGFLWRAPLCGPRFLSAVIHFTIWMTAASACQLPLIRIVPHRSIDYISNANPALAACTVHSE
jgi:hypothetical protein